MNKRLILIRSISIIILAILFLTTKIALSSFDIWQRTSNGIKDTVIKAISFDRVNYLLGYVGSDKAVYKTEDGGKYWRQVLSIRGQNTAVNFLLIDSSDSKIVYAATENGLYRTNNKGNSWQRIFQGKNIYERNCLSVALDKDKLYLGTKNGLFISKDNARTWFKHPGEVANSEISFISLRDNLVYLATSEGVFKSIDFGENFRNVYSVLELKEDIAEESNNDEQITSVSKIHQVIVDESNIQKIYLATDEAVLVSLDGAKTWQRLPISGLVSSSINSIQPVNNRLFVGSDEGVFEFDGQKWQAIYQGLMTNIINFLSCDAKGNLWLATDRGVYKIDFNLSESADAREIILTKELIDNFKDEPTIQKIQEQAVKYAEVHPDKINTWRRQATLAAFMPDLTLDFDRTIVSSMTTSSSSPNNSGYRAEIGPQDWAVNLQWDLGELIWNPDQTSIDSRSKLMVELRDSILDEVTRIYFERRRQQIELLLAPPKDEKEKIEKDLRLQELTASIDALTGGYLSRMLNKGN